MKKIDVPASFRVSEHLTVKPRCLSAISIEIIIIIQQYFTIILLYFCMYSQFRIAFQQSLRRK